MIFWVQEGNFEQTQRFESRKLHFIYIPPSPDIGAWEYFPLNLFTFPEKPTSLSVTLYGHDDGRYSITIMLDNEDRARACLKAIEAKGCVVDGLGTHDKQLSLTSTHLGYIGNFINAITHIIPHFDEIKPSICNALNINPLISHFPLHTWIQEGDFKEKRVPVPTLLNRRVEFICTLNTPLVKKVALLGHRDGTFTLSIQPLNYHAYQQILQTIDPEFGGARAPWHTQMTITMTSSDIAILNQYIDNIERFQPAVNQIRTLIISLATEAYSYDRDPNITNPLISEVNIIDDFDFLRPPGYTQHLYQLQSSLRQRFLRLNQSANLTPPKGLHERHIELLNIPPESIPDAYLCNISFTIMDDPVYDPNYPQYTFDRRNIERWLELSSKHPHTNLDLNATMLVAKADLKKDIEDFISQLARNAPPFMAPTGRL